jgi:hypothetical protein
MDSWEIGAAIIEIFMENKENRIQLQAPFFIKFVGKNHVL